MGMCAEKCAQDYAISREDQDAFAIESYRRAQQALKDGVFEEVVPVEIPQRRGDPVVVDTDEEPNSVNLEKLPSLRPAFDRSEKGSVTAANASSLNDGAAALILMTEEDAKQKGIQPLARIRGFGDAAQAPGKTVVTLVFICAILYLTIFSLCVSSFLQLISPPLRLWLYQ